MASLVQKLVKGEFIKAPNFVESNIVYEVIMGSRAYGTNREDSDYDIYGICIPPKHVIFPHTAGYIMDFDTDFEKFHQFQPAGVTAWDKYYEMQIFSIVQFFYLAAIKCAPNQIDSLYVPQDCITHISPIGDLIRHNHKLFLSKKIWHSFKGYAFAQLKKAKSLERTGKRKEIVEQFGYDVKFASHIIRLMDEVEQLLVEGEMDLRRSAEKQKAIKRGEYTLEQIEQEFVEKEKYLERLYESSTLPYGPDRDKLRALLVECLELHYGKLGVVLETNRHKIALSEILRIAQENL